MIPTCYAQRLLNPFRGVMKIIEHQGAEAVTTDGVQWDIYVRDTTLNEDSDETMATYYIELNVTRTN